VTSFISSARLRLARRFSRRADIDGVLRRYFRLIRY
jgi:hypothetical protein